MVEGWGFGRSPRIEPMDGAGPSSFVLPAEQESSAIPAGLAREWLTGVTATAVERALTPGSGVGVDMGELLTKVIALHTAGVPASEMAAARQLLTARGTGGSYEYTSLESWSNSLGTGAEVDPEDPSFPVYGNLSRYTQAVIAADALEGDPSDYAAIDLRDSLLSLIDEPTGKLRRWVTGGGETLSEEPGLLAGAINALAATGTLPPKALKSIDLLVGRQDPDDGGFGLPVSGQALAIRALAGARAGGVSGLEVALAEAGEFIADLQEPDGSVRAAAGGGAGSAPTFASTAAGAIGLALADFPTEAERAAKRLSRFQVIAAYVGMPDPSTGETAPAEPLIGAFLSTEADLRHVLAYGLPEDGPHGPYNEAHVPTAQALEALDAAGPYGPHSASLSRQSLWFGKQTVGTQGSNLIATLTNEDERSLSVAAVGLAGGEAGDFVLDGADCLGRTLAPGQGCELVAGFAPTAGGVREAVVLVELTGGGQTFELSLGGTGFPAPVTKPGPQGDPAPLPVPQLTPPSPPPGADAIVPFKANRDVTGRVLRVARLSCPMGAPCQVELPRKVLVKIAGKLYRAAVLAPASLEGGETATVSVRLSKRALAALAGHGAMVELKISILTAGGTLTRMVRVRIGAPPG
jgi:hypothetical protein